MEIWQHVFAKHITRKLAHHYIGVIKWVAIGLLALVIIFLMFIGWVAVNIISVLL